MLLTLDTFLEELISFNNRFSFLKENFEIINSIKFVNNFSFGEVKHCTDYYKGYEIITTKQKIYFLITQEEDCCEKFDICCENYEKFLFSKIISINLEKTEEESETNNDSEDRIRLNIEFKIKTTKGLLKLLSYNEHEFRNHKIIAIYNQKTEHHLI